MKRKGTEQAGYDAIIVLGAQVREDGTPSEVLRRRMTLALECYGRRPALIVCCGARGDDEPVSEGEFMCGWLHARGIPHSALLAETGSYDTMQNIRNAKRLLDERGLKAPLLVTSKYHLPRACAICRRARVAVADSAGSPSRARFFVKNHVREALAWVKFLLSR